MSKPAIPNPPAGDFATRRFLDAVRETLQIITGRRGTPIKPLAADATTADIINKINEVIDRLQ